MRTLDLIFRFAAISQLLLMAVILVRDHRDQPSGLLAAAWALSIGCYLLMLPIYRDWYWGGWAYLVYAGANSAPVLFWLVTRSLFEDSFRLRWSQLIILLLTVAIGLIIFNIYDRSSDSAVIRFVTVLSQMIPITFAVLALFAVLRDWRSDLVESRRRFRVVWLAVAGFYSLVIAAVTILLAGAGATAGIDTMAFDTINSGIILLLCLGFISGMLRTRGGFLVAAPRAQSQPEVQKARAEEDFSFIKADLQRLMNEERAYCEHGLSIGCLAERLGQKEYKLRRFINGKFGYRNFNEFLNHYRIEEAARQLVAPTTRHLPVLTIALDVGYRSLAPFNRAFKEFMEMTPTEYRTSKLSPQPGATVENGTAPSD